MRPERPRALATVWSQRRAVLLPLAVYLGVTIGVPFLNGASARPEFWKHALEVVAVAGILVALRWGVGAARLPRRASRAAAAPAFDGSARSL